MITLFSEEPLDRNWWRLPLRGLIAVLLGLCDFVWPGFALAMLVVLFGAFTLIHGLFSVWLAVGERRQSQRWWLLLIEGLVSIAVGGNHLRLDCHHRPGLALPDPRSGPAPSICWRSSPLSGAGERSSMHGRFCWSA